MNWHRKGYKDATEGDKPNRKALQSCSAHVSYDKTAALYTEGYTSGIEKFCTQENGFYWGSLGHAYDDTCPVILEKKFLEGYENGKRQYEAAEEQRKRLEEERKRLEEERERLEKERKRLEEANKH